MEKKQFKAESKRLLDLMIHSIYTNREIFIRELISNASDATDKLYYNAMKTGNTGINREELSIQIAIDKENRTLTISDHGCGMTAEELENNLGTIAKSGSLSFKQENEKQEDIDIIGQFGVGFYAAFMVAKSVKVRSMANGQAFEWESDGSEGYTIVPCDKQEQGTEIILYLKDNTEDENYDEFLEPYPMQSLVKKYSDYIRYPIQMDVETSQKKEGTEDEYETITETRTLNSMIPIWKKKKSEITAEDYNNFYKEKFYDFEDPAKVIHYATEGVSTFNAMLFVPKRAPFNYYTRDFEKGLQLYSSGVLIMDKCSDLLPDYFSFIKGIVDSADLSLNISREMLQQDRQLKRMAVSLEKKIKSELESMLKNDRESYDEVFKNFGLQLKYGVYSDYGTHKDVLKDLILFYSSFSDKYTSLAEYVSRMKDDQKYIYYACGESVQKIKTLPQTEFVNEKGMEILYLTDDIDEFALKMLEKYADKEFKNVSDKDLGLETDSEKEEINKLNEDNKDVLQTMTDALDGKVKAVKLTSRLKNNPVYLSADGMVSIEMEKVMNAMPNNEAGGVQAEKVLEISSNHNIFDTLCKLYAEDKEKLSAYAYILYTQALLIEGIAIEDPVTYTNEVCKIMSV